MHNSVLHVAFSVAISTMTTSKPPDSLIRLLEQEGESPLSIETWRGMRNRGRRALTAHLNARANGLALKLFVKLRTQVAAAGATSWKEQENPLNAINPQKWRKREAQSESSENLLLESLSHEPPPSRGKRKIAHCVGRSDAHFANAALLLLYDAR